MSEQKRRRKHRRRRRKIWPLLLICVAAALAFGARYYMEHRTSSAYTVVSTGTREDTVSSQYQSFAGAVLRYSDDGASLSRDDGTLIWNESFDMHSPTVDLSDEAMVIYDKKGTVMYVFGTNGIRGTISTELPILKAKVSSQGMIAAILEDGETTWINFYTVEGQTIATGKTRIDSPGYPVDLDVSKNSELLMVSYLYVDGDTPTSYVAFYSFGSAGQNQMDNIVSGYTYPNVMIPQVSFLGGDVAVAVRDNGLTLYSGGQIPAENVSVTEETEIASTFISDRGVGLIVQGGEKQQGHTLKIYNTGGKVVKEQELQNDYGSVVISGGQLILHNDRQVNIYEMDGTEKFSGTIEEGAIQSICRTGSNRYMVVMEDGLETIRLK
ncbi:MAG TPA: hypothetical protein DF613_06090 [Lachnospiraceae bacterium]|nr:hypothetical protein [Lachnospiraceae bacterium]